MEKVFSYLNGFLGGLGSLFLALVPVTILWFILTGGYGLGGEFTAR